MKRILAILLVLALVCGGAVWAADSLFQMGTERDESTVTVSVALNEEISEEAATMLQGELYYDPQVLEPVSVRASDAYSFLNCMISERHPRVQFSFADENSDALTLPAGTVVTAEFAVLADADAELRLEMDLQTADGFVVADLTDYCTVSVDEARENPFTDVPEDAFYHEPVLWAVEQGITTGIEADTFAPYAGCNRSQVVTFLWRAADCPIVEEDNPFTDVKPSDFYYNAVLWAVENGITNGLDSTHFGPNASCNRSQVVTFLYRAASDKTVTGSVNPFGDVKTSDFYYNAVLWAVENGITNGLKENVFGPNETCDRSQVVTFLYRAMN